MAQLKGAFPEARISQAHSFGRDVPVRLVRAFPGRRCVGINMLSDAWHDLFDPRLGGWADISEGR